MYGYDAHRRKVAKLMGRDYLRFGLFGQIFGLGLMCTDAAPAGELLLVISTGVLVGGCAKYAKFHRLNRAWALLGLLSVVGVFILVLLPQRGRRQSRGSGFAVIFAEPYRRDVWRMDVRVKLDERIGTGVNEAIMLQLPRGSNIGSAMKTLAGAIPQLGDGDVMGANYLVNGKPADRKDELSDGDEMVVKVGGFAGNITGPI